MPNRLPHRPPLCRKNRRLLFLSPNLSPRRCAGWKRRKKNTPQPRRSLPQLGITCPDASTAVLAQYADEGSIADWAKSHIATLTLQGLVNGTNTGVLPQGELTWAQTAALLYRLSSFTPVTGNPDTAEKTALCTANDYLNIRLAPDTGAKILDCLKGGRTAVVTAEPEGW